MHLALFHYPGNLIKRGSSLFFPLKPSLTSCSHGRPRRLLLDRPRICQAHMGPRSPKYPTRIQNTVSKVPVYNIMTVVLAENILCMKVLGPLRRNSPYHMCGCQAPVLILRFGLGLLYWHSERHMHSTWTSNVPKFEELIIWR